MSNSLNCLFILKNLSKINIKYLNRLSINKYFNFYFHVLETNVINYKKKKIEIKSFDNILEELNIDFIILQIETNCILKITNLLNNLKFIKIINCFSNISLKLTKYTENYVYFHNNCNISYILKTLNMSNVKLKEIQNKEHLISKQNKEHLISKELNELNELNEFSNLCLSYLNKQNNVYDKLIKQKSIYEAVYIEFRNLSHSEFIIKNCIIKLDNKWSHTVICCNDNYYHTKELCDRINKNINIIKLDITNATYNYYNNLLLSKEFWEMLNGEKILIYQSDSLIYNSNIDDFLKYDYIGMPFLFKHYISAPSTVGNGGLSLRSKKTMLEVLNNPNCDKRCSNIAEHFKLKTKFDNIPEDIFFSNNIQNLKLGLVPDDNVGKLFASSDNINCFGMHAIWKYNKSWKPLIVEFMEKNYNEKVEICKKIKIDTNSHLIPYPSNSFLHESSGDNNKSNKNSLILLSHGLGGGLSKYVIDILNNINQLITIDNYEVVSNELLENSKHNYYNNNEIVDYMLNNNFNNLLLHLNGNFLDYENIYKIIRKIKCKTLKILITIHDFYWIYRNKPNILIKDMLNDSNKILSEPVKYIFSNSQIIIFPSKKIYNIYNDYFNLIPDVKIKNKILRNCKIEKHIDLYYYNKERYIHKITNDEINIVFIGRSDNIKGFDNLIEIITNGLNNDKMRYNIYLIGNIYKKIPNCRDNIKVHYIIDYVYNELFDILNKIKPHLFLLLSNFYETWSYTLSSILFTGLPVFCCFDVYSFRLINIPNVRYYRLGDSFKIINEKLDLFINEIYKNKLSTSYKDIKYYKNDDYYIPTFYFKIYDKVIKNAITNSYDVFMKQTIFNSNINVYAIYFPQFHRISENDSFQYYGYSDMNNFRKMVIEKQNTTELKIPSNDFGYYDLLAEDNIIEKQIKTAIKYGLKGFAIYHYWFDNNAINPKNHNLMERVSSKFLDLKTDNFKYFFIWANENWNENLYNNNCIDYINWKNHFNNLLKYFNDYKYYKINNKPVFYIIHYWLFDKNVLEEMINYFNNLAIINGFNGLYVGFCLNGDSPKYDMCDCYYINSPAWKSCTMIGQVEKNNNFNICNYENYITNFEDKLIPDNIKNKDIIFNLFTDFNNSVRNFYKNTNITNFKYINTNKENFKKYLYKSKMFYSKYKNSNNLMLVNAWNEWGENMVLEPDNKNNYDYLEILGNFIKNY